MFHLFQDALECILAIPGPAFILRCEPFCQFLQQGTRFGLGQQQFSHALPSTLWGNFGTTRCSSQLPGKRHFACVAYDLFVKYMALYVGVAIAVGIEISPMTEFRALMPSDVAYYEGELYNLIREGKGVPAVPLVVVGVTSW